MTPWRRNLITQVEVRCQALGLFQSWVGPHRGLGLEMSQDPGQGARALGLLQSCVGPHRGLGLEKMSQDGQGALV